MSEAEDTQAFMIDGPNGGLAALYHPPQTPAPGNPVGCLILVGGPQYRAGAHRQYIDLARHLAKNGVGVLRFDYSGMGDSDGDLADLDGRGDDIVAAANALKEKLGKNARIFPWGLCEGASAIFMHHDKIPNIAGAIIANPWVGDARIEAQVHWRHYYLGKLRAKSLWQRLRSGKLLTTGLFENVRGFLGGATLQEEAVYSPSLEALPDHLMHLISRNKPILYLASADDRERETFDYATRKDERWSRVRQSPLFIRKDLANADHTFSRQSAKRDVRVLTSDFISAQTKPVRVSAPG